MPPGFPARSSSAAEAVSVRCAAIAARAVLARAGTGGVRRPAHRRCSPARRCPSDRRRLGPRACSGESSTRQVPMHDAAARSSRRRPWPRDFDHSKIEQLHHRALLARDAHEEGVRRFEVSVHDPLRMRDFERASDLVDHVERFIERHAPVLKKRYVERDSPSRRSIDEVVAARRATSRHAYTSTTLGWCSEPSARASRKNLRERLRIVTPSSERSP